MEKLEIVTGDIEEEVFRIFDNYLFNLEANKRVRILEGNLSLVEGADNLSETDKKVALGLRRAAAAHFPLRRFGN